MMIDLITALFQPLTVDSSKKLEMFDALEKKAPDSFVMIGLCLKALPTSDLFQNLVSVFDALTEL